MDAVTLVAAAVAIACDQSRQAALEDVLRDRELQAMRAAHLESLIAQRMFTSNTQLGHVPPPVTWRTAHTMAHNDAVQQRAVMNQAARALRRGDDDRAAAMLEVAGPQFEEEFDESDSEDSDAEHAQQRCARCGSTRNLELLLPAGPFAGAPIEQRIFCQECIQA